MIYFINKYIIFTVDLEIIIVWNHIDDKLLNIFINILYFVDISFNWMCTVTTFWCNLKDKNINF